MRYLTATRNYGLFFSKSRGRWKGVEASFKIRAIEASSDANWANDSVYRKFITGGYLMYYCMPVGWMSKDQTETAMSTAEAEHRVIIEVM